MKLKGRTALVTGGSRGIGRAIALALAEEGADVAINYVSSEPAAREVADRIRKIGRHSLLAQADGGDYPDTFRMAQDVRKACGHPDIPGNNAGINSDKTSGRRKRWVAGSSISSRPTATTSRAPSSRSTADC